MNEPNEIERAVAPYGAATSAFAVGSIVASRYVLLTHLGSDRFGPVFEAVDRALSGGSPDRERRVALHAMDGAAAAEILAALERWRAAPQSWRHPNIVKLLDFGRHGGTAYALTELLEGLTLRRVLDDVAPELLAPEEAFAVVGKVGAALRFAHAKGVVHGDVRPETVFVTTSFGVKVLDFWPPAVAAVRLFDAGAGEPATPADDVYGLACLAYELLTGRHPFNGNAPSEARREELKPAPILGLTHRRWQAIARGLELDSAERTPSVAEFLTELGVTGHEELPRSAQAQAAPQAAPAPAAPPPPQPRYAVAAGARAVPMRAVHEVDDADIPTLRSAVRTRPARPARVPRRRRRSRSWLFVVPVLLVAGLAVAVLRDYDEMRGAVTDLIAASVEHVEGALETPEGEASPVSAPAAVAANAGVSAGTTAIVPAADAAREADVVEPETGTSPEATDSVAAPGDEHTVDVARPAAVGPRTAGREMPRPQTADARTASRNPDTQTARLSLEQRRTEPRASAATAKSAPAVSVAAAASAGRAGPGFALVEPRVTAAEGDALARVTIRHTGNSEEPVRVFWWTGGHTAEADDDFADLEGVETLPPGESRDILVPIANDVWPEDAESFFVYFGLELARRRTQMPAAQAEVVVVDDDR